MNPAQILTIRLQFEKIAQRDIDEAKSQMAEPFEGVRKEADASGGALIDVVRDIAAAMKSFDWGHPIRSLHNVFSTLLSSIQDRLSGIGKIGFIVASALVGVFLGAFRQMVKAQSEVLRMYTMISDSSEAVMAMGTTMAQRVSKSLLEISDVAFVTGQSIGDVAKIYTQLGQARVPPTDLKNLTQTAILASKALGANVDQLTQMMSSMRVVGRVSTDQIGKVVNIFSNVQDRVGLTESEMSGLIQTTTMLTRQMGALGAKERDILNLASAAAKLTGLFGELGLGAERASAILAKLFDPTMIGENAMLIRQMGFSMQEYMNMLRGGEVDQKKLTEGLIDAAKEIQTMQDRGAHAMALQMRSQQLGFENMHEALRLAQEGDKILAGWDERMEDADLAAKAAEGMASLDEVIGRLRNRFMAFFGKFAVPIIEKLQVVVEKLEEWWLKNADAINEFVDAFVEGIGDFLRNLDFKKIGDFLKTVFNFFGMLIKHGKTLLPIIVGVAGAFAMFKVLGPVVGMIGKLTNVFGGLTKGLKGVGDAAKSGGALQGLKGVTGVLQSFGKMAGVALVLIALAAAVWIFSDALEKLVKIAGDPNFAKALIVAVGALAIFVLGTMALMAAMAAGPQAAIMFAGAAILLAVAAAVWIFAKALEVGVKALGNLAEMTSGLAALAEIGKDKTFRTGLVETGKALGQFFRAAITVGALKAAAFFALGKGLKELALGLWVLGRTETFDKIPRNLDEVAKTISTLAEGRFRRNVDRVGEGFKALTQGITDLAKLDVSKFAEIGRGMQGLTAGINQWLQAMQAGGTFKFLGIGKNLGEVSVGFKELALGVWVLGQTVGKMEDISRNMGLLTQPIENIFKAMRAGGPGVFESAAAFSKFAEGIKSLAGAESVISRIGYLPSSISNIGSALNEFNRSSDRNFIKFLKDLKGIGPVDIAVQTDGKPVELDTRVRDMKAGSMVEQIQVSFEMWGERIVGAIDRLNESNENRHGAQFEKLRDIARFTGRGT